MLVNVSQLRSKTPIELPSCNNGDKKKVSDRGFRRHDLIDQVRVRSRGGVVTFYLQSRDPTCQDQASNEGLAGFGDLIKVYAQENG